jgi:ferric-chelate reductase [NAD(P)H]
MEVGSAIDVKALFNLTYGMYIVSTEWEGRKNGQIANSVMQVTASPNTVAVCLNKDNLTWELLEKSGKFSVTVLEEEVPMTFIGTFGFKSGRDIDKFASCGWMAAPGGTPVVLDHALSWIEARVFNRVDVYTHSVFFGEVISSSCLKEGCPLTYANYHLVKKGKSPKSAPTYNLNAVK